jgi:N-hydroxyarylamine O-acetyltransferase
MPQEWTIERLDLGAYLRRVGLDASAPPAPDGAGLRRLQRAHQHSIPFENADILLGRGIDLDLDAIQRKLVSGRRGGYCHEHNLLFAAALERLGYEVGRLTGRVLVGGGDAVRPRTHMVLRVATPEADLVADVGFGGPAPVAPVPLLDGAEAARDGWAYRVAQAPPDGWVLGARAPDGWGDLYSFGLEPAHLVDYRVATHYTSTHPRSPFVGALRVALARPEAWLVLQGRELSESRPGEVTRRRTLDDEAFARALVDTFGLDLSRDDLVALTRLTEPG